ncbi:MAG: UDP-glucose/GDP-mannose dehydrogenase family protein, partial [Nitrospiraceae bacterium]|nr:UDP-glucose/GDP-mannose dehydrogenase family protein [Nitrospiraceae bacterium]
FGGSCFPKDVAALIQTGEKAGYQMEIIRAAARVNERQRLLMVEKIQAAVGDLKGKTIGMLGLSFKPNTSDLRESPAVFIAERLMSEGCQVRVYDPAALEEGARLLPKATICTDPYDAARDADALTLMTEWNQFRNLDFEQIKALLRRPLFLDLRNVYEADRMAALGFRYVSVGRPSREPGA